MANEQLMTTAGGQSQAIEAGQVASHGFGEQSIARVAETATTALAAQATAAVNARHIMALQRPRDIALARQRLLADCRRPAFAEVAIYRKPVGEGVEGPSIRMAEAAARAMGNILAEVAAIYDDPQKRIVRVSATDLEANITYPFDVTIAKTIERSKPMPGRKILMERKNSKGYPVYVIEATDEEILDKERATASKALRTCLLRLIPGDILEEAIEACYRVREEEIRRNLPEARTKMVGAFAALGVSVQQLSDYLGHAISDTPAEELNLMRSLHAAIKDKETTWAAAMEQRRGSQEDAAPAPKSTDELAARLAERAKAAKVNTTTGEVSPERFTDEQNAALDREIADEQGQ